MTTYIVKSGDTLSKLAARFYGDARKFPVLAAANSISSPYTIVPGQSLVIPDQNAAPPAGGGTGNISEQRLAQVHPALAARTRAMIELVAQQGTELLVTQGLRTWAEQDALYAKGRTVAPIGKKYCVTNARGGQSYHNFGLAIDIVVLDAIGKADWDTSHPGWTQAAQAGKSLGLEWGGDWKSIKDLPHFQYTGGLTLARCRELFPSGLPAVWAEVQ